MSSDELSAEEEARLQQLVKNNRWRSGGRLGAGNE